MLNPSLRITFPLISLAPGILSILSLLSASILASFSSSGLRGNFVEESIFSSSVLSSFVVALVYDDQGDTEPFGELYYSFLGAFIYKVLIILFFGITFFTNYGICKFNFFISLLIRSSILQ